MSRVGFAAFVAVLTWPQAALLHSVPDKGDPLFSTWRIAWVAHQIVRDPLRLFDGNIFHPERLTLTYSDPVIVEGLMAAPFLWLGAHQLTVYTLLFLSGFALSGVTMYFLLQAADRTPGRRARRRRDLRRVSLPLRALQPSGAADGDVDAARADRRASDDGERPDS